MSVENITIVGAGVVGLIISNALQKKWPDCKIQIFDEGPDPRKQPECQHTFGATYSGLDARHISLTETAPWTASNRARLIRQDIAQGGWNCLSDVEISQTESAWLNAFENRARLPKTHSSCSNRVIAVNGRGMDGWHRLNAERPDIFTPTSEAELLPIICTSAEDLKSEWAAERRLDPLRVTNPVKGIPNGLAPLESRISDHTLHGSFLVAGTAYQVKTICCQLISELEITGVDFCWNSRIDVESDGGLPLPKGWVIWAAGASTVHTQLLHRAQILLQGVLGCWAELPNPGFTRPFKLLGVEPVNFINVTPVGGVLLLSGGYGWVGERPYHEAIIRAAPLVETFASEVNRLFQGTGAGIVSDARTAACIRPSLPSGEPLVKELHLWPKHRVVMCVGHAAGGFTQSPAVAERILSIVR